MSAPQTSLEPKNDVAHYDQHDGPETQSVVDRAEESGGKSKASKVLGNTKPHDGDLGARWLATYTGPRPELTDKLNNKIRNRIDASLLPIIFLIYFSELSTSRCELASRGRR